MSQAQKTTTRRVFDDLQWLIFLRSLTPGQFADLRAMLDALRTRKPQLEYEAMSFLDSLSREQH